MVSWYRNGDAGPRRRLILEVTRALSGSASVHVKVDDDGLGVLALKRPNTCLFYTSPGRLFVITHAANLIADAHRDGFLCSRLVCPRLREIIPS
jgi:hypothetical protein